MGCARGLVLGLLLSAWLCQPASGQIVLIEFSGTYSIDVGENVLGVVGPTALFEYSILYDTSLDTNLFEFTGGLIGTAVTENDWFGYSADGILETSLTFGTETFTEDDLVPTEPLLGISADLWFDVDIALPGATPTRAAIAFLDPDGLLFLGGHNIAGEPLNLASASAIFASGGDAFGPMTITVTPVPEASTAMVLLSALLVLGMARQLGRARHPVGGTTAAVGARPAA